MMSKIRGIVAFASLIAIIWIWMLMIFPNPTWIGQLPAYLKFGIGLSGIAFCASGIAQWFIV